MASEAQVKRYLTYWFQLGKKVVMRNGFSAMQPQSLTNGKHYSQEFETIWQLAISPETGDCYLEGTDETIADLLTPKWDILPCSRCDMPVPIKSAGIPPNCCPCFDLSTWPNTELPAPRDPVCSQTELRGICDRLNRIIDNRIT
ncbi:hypothetical protein BJP36_26350 [Moorena producens JHB]|uniref:Uncharacterized protein n=1 Tax=Moorena producens (strain JHB) TaxID=1454205 RepID=A0A1D9G5K8_MOOP1|nr:MULTISPECIES: hypothetical protein [Moorena]AOY82908.1 hypothetical protein BJP36_26350 [Moorena producens JHB]NEQ11589.1 hypothetical protein [Moorena sp. SIO4E2]